MAGIVVNNKTGIRPTGFGVIILSDTEKRQRIGAQRAIAAGIRKFDHSLAELLFTINAFDIIGLVDDIDEMEKFCHPPKFLINADGRLESATDIAIFGFAQIAMTAFMIILVIAPKRLDNDGVTPRRRKQSQFNLCGQ